MSIQQIKCTWPNDLTSIGISQDQKNCVEERVNEHFKNPKLAVEKIGPLKIFMTFERAIISLPKDKTYKSLRQGYDVLSGNFYLKKSGLYTDDLSFEQMYTLDSKDIPLDYRCGFLNFVFNGYNKFKFSLKDENYINQDYMPGFIEIAYIWKKTMSFEKWFNFVEIQTAASLSKDILYTSLKTPAKEFCAKLFYKALVSRGHIIPTYKYWEKKSVSNLEAILNDKSKNVDISDIYSLKIALITLHSVGKERKIVYYHGNVSAKNILIDPSSPHKLKFYNFKCGENIHTEDEEKLIKTKNLLESTKPSAQNVFEKHQQKNDIWNLGLVALRVMEVNVNFDSEKVKKCTSGLFEKIENNSTITQEEVDTVIDGCKNAIKESALNNPPMKNMFDRIFTDLKKWLKVDPTERLL